METIWAAPNALAALDIAARVAAHTNAEVCRIGLALDAARRWDPDFEVAWRDRMDKRLSRYHRLSRWLMREHRLGVGWTWHEAAVVLWTSTSLATFDLLVHDMGLTTQRYELLLRSMLRATLQWSMASDRDEAQVSILRTRRAKHG